MFKILLGGFNFIKTVYELSDNLSYHLLCTILERDMMYIFSNCVKNVRVQALNDSVKFSRQLMQKNLDLLSCDLIKHL